MRFLEDKLIEADSLIEDLHKRGKSWQNFISTSRRLDRVYNGIIFKEHNLLDKDSFNVDEKVFDRISQNLSHAYSPYDFNAIPIHILGSIYERFLGKVIVATDKRARVEEKPEVRKAGGVYYTPEYIVRYIVDNTVGKLIEGKTPKEMAEMRFADIACGSGSFLLDVYDTLLGYHTAYYNRNKRTRAEGLKARCIEREDGTLQLSLWQKRQILLDNIYGVDIDPQAVEVAQLSLYLKLLEDETTGSAHRQQLELREALLPSLNRNIICGNSLIGWDIIEGKLFDSLDERKLNPMNFEDAFPEVMKRGGFDALVGNPPWGAQFGDFELGYHRRRNAEIIVRMIDSFMYFVYRGSKLVAKNGSFGMILPDVILYQSDNEKLRRYLLNTFSLEAILNMGDVFDKVTRPTAILIARRLDPNEHNVRIADFSSLSKPAKPDAIKSASNFSPLSQSLFSGFPGAAFITSQPTRYHILNKLKLVTHTPLIELVDQDGIQRGVSPDLKEAFIVDNATAQQWKLEEDYLRRVLTGGRQVKRYYIERPNTWLIYSTRKINIKELPNIRAYIDQFASQITCKEVKQRKHSIYSLHRARDENIFAKKEKFLGVITEDEIILALDVEGTFATDGLYLFGISDALERNYVMGILNSRLFVFIYRLLAFEHGRVLAQVKPTVLNQLPIRTLDPASLADKARHDRMVQLVDQMLDAKKQLAEARSERDRNFYESKCATIDRQIDELVYQLYDLTAEEIAIVEAGGK